MSHAAVMIPSLDRIAGAERQAMQLAKGLCHRGWRVTVVALSGEGKAARDELHAGGVEFVTLGMRKGLADLRGWIRLSRWLWREHPDVVHAHLPQAAWLARWSRALAPMRVLVDTVHTSFTGKAGRRLGYALSRWWPDRVTAVSRAAAHAHIGKGMVSEKNLTVLPNGIDIDEWRPDAEVRAEVRHAMGLTDDFLWLAVGRLEAVKDYPTLLKALTFVPQLGRLVILGEGPLRGELTQLAAQLGLEHRVHFIGFQKDVRRWMQAADGLVLASRYEGLPMVLLEAGACGLPCVATAVAGTREVVINGETGWLACAEGVDALAAVVSRMMRMPLAERYAMGQRARHSVIERFSMESVLDRWERLYAELLEPRPTRGKRVRAREALTRQSATEA
ncbi:MAG: glycosyltransferase [Terracidiphilus sp.]|jgi:glycosyltransferase involved in cell wall biosynthesis